MKKLAQCFPNFLGTIIIVFLSSCGHDKPQINHDYHDSILAGQRAGDGVYFQNIEPDWAFFISDPWVQTHFSTSLDFDNDGISDFEINGSMCDPTMLGADCEEISITPVGENKICTRPDNNWLDTLNLGDTIDSRLNWSSATSLIYSYYWDMSGNTDTSGNWHSVLEGETPRYFAFQINKQGKPYYGWVAMHRSLAFGNSFHYILPEYGVIYPWIEE
jgi:hypothetical protein